MQTRLRPVHPSKWTHVCLLSLGHVSSQKDTRHQGPRDTHTWLETEIQMKTGPMVELSTLRPWTTPQRWRQNIIVTFRHRRKEEYKRTPDIFTDWRRRWQRRWTLDIDRRHHKTFTDLKFFRLKISPFLLLTFKAILKHSVGRQFTLDYKSTTYKL